MSGEKTLFVFVLTNVFFYAEKLLHVANFNLLFVIIPGYSTVLSSLGTKVLLQAQQRSSAITFVILRYSV